MPLMKEPHPPPQAPLPWILPSLFAAFNVVLLVVFSGLFFAFPCRWLAQNGEWAFPLITGLLCILTFISLVSLNFSDPGILHQGSNEQGPMTVHVVRVDQRAFRLQWCPRCCFHRPPRTHHCPWCNICVEDFDHHCKWVNNCIGHRNFRFFMLLVLSLCLYLGAMLVTCLIFLVRTTHLPFSMDKAMAYPPRNPSGAQHPGSCTRHRLPGATLRPTADPSHVGDRGRALLRGQVPVPAGTQPLRPWLCQQLVFNNMCASGTQVHG
ncbi:probable palmitoyltransferase ZDHHC19 isoform X5 [Suricata suricatta]|uniref:probable palmitoyltransferase ZDHHC19 isoform X5 n=1 Tax=Suricata suricatta TaxID=37032 RepID=UPI0011552D77|nr:probable palmitoyltransferase ZDHHC19 isoform X5 [Suricata suricatta]